MMLQNVRDPKTAQICVDVGGENGFSGWIFPVFRYDQVCGAPFGFHIFLVHRLNGVLILFHYGHNGSAAFYGIPVQPTDKSDVRIGIHENP